MGIRIPERDDVYYQADIAVQCTPASQSRWADAPVVIVEVLSPSTAAHDRGRKGFDYRELPSVNEIVFLFTSAIRAEVWRRVSEGWVIEDMIGRDAVLRLRSIGVDVLLGDVYGTISLDAGGPGSPGDA